MQDRSIKIGGSLHGVANTGDNAAIHSHSQADTKDDLNSALGSMLYELASRYPDIPNTHRIFIFEAELIQKIHENPTLRQRLLNAVKMGGIELSKVLTNNPFVSVSIELVKGWLEDDNYKQATK
jgi:hypothetical protein